MNLLKLRKQLEIITDDIKKSGGDPEASEVMIETVDVDGEIYYEGSFGFTVDDRNDIGLSPMNK